MLKTQHELALLEFAKRAEVLATRVLEGRHRSRRGGEGTEFHSALPYADGEDVRRIDWKRYASSDRLYVKRFEREEKTGWSFIVDQSASMNYGAKLNVAREWCAASIFLSELWADPWRLFSADGLNRTEVFTQLAQKKLGTYPENFAEMVCDASHHLVVLSDFFFDEKIIDRSLKTWTESAHSVQIIQTLSWEEQDFPFKDMTDFRDFESRDRLLLDSNIIRDRYLAELKQLQDSLRSRLRPQDSFRCVLVDRGDWELELFNFYEELGT